MPTFDQYAKTPTLEQIRGAIDSGKTGDKVPFPDPAAAPLGADAEAGGASPTKAELRIAARSLAKTPATRRWQAEAQGIALYASTVAVIGALLLTVVALA